MKDIPKVIKSKHERNYSTYLTHEKLLSKSNPYISPYAQALFPLFTNAYNRYFRSGSHIFYTLYTERPLERKVGWKFRIMLSGSNRGANSLIQSGGCQILLSSSRKMKAILSCISRLRQEAYPPYPLLLILNTPVMHNTTCAHTSEEDKGTGRELAYTR